MAANERVSMVCNRSWLYFIFVRVRLWSFDEFAIIRFDGLLSTTVVSVIFPISIMRVLNVKYTFCLDGPSKHKQSKWQNFTSVVRKNIDYDRAYFKTAFIAIVHDCYWTRHKSALRVKTCLHNTSDKFVWYYIIDRQ